MKKISHMKLLKLIKKGKLKEGTKIYASDFAEPLFYENGTLYFYNCYDEREPLTFKGFIENIKYAYFTIENSSKKTQKLFKRKNKQ